jgi:sulfur relay protein TusC/DsrF
LQETLDRILTAAAYDLYVSVLFRDEGVYQVVGSSPAAGREGPSWLASLRTLDLYGINQVLVDRASLRARGLHEHDLAIAAEIIDCDQARVCLEAHDRLFVC